MATKIGELFVNLRANTAQFTRGMDRAQRSTRRLRSGVLRLTAALSAFGGAYALVRVTRGLISINREYERLNAQLITVTGSQERATRAFKGLERFAQETPFQIEENVQAFVRLRALGIEPTNEMMRDFGNVASGMGRRITDFARAVQGAVTGETEALKAFGIVSRIQGESISFSFQGVTRTIQRNSQEIVDALQAIGRENFAGAMANEMDTLNGIISNFQDNIGIVARRIGEHLMPLLKQWARALRDIAGGKNDIVVRAVQGIGKIIEVIGRAIHFLATHTLTGEFGLVGLAFLGVKGMAGLALIGLGIDELLRKLYPAQTELERVNLNLIETEEALHRRRRELSTMQETYNRNLEQGIGVSGEFAERMRVLGEEIIPRLQREYLQWFEVLVKQGDAMRANQPLVQGFADDIITLGQALQDFTMPETPDIDLGFGARSTLEERQAELARIYEDLEKGRAAVPEFSRALREWQREVARTNQQLRELAEHRMQQFQASMVTAFGQMFGEIITQTKLTVATVIRFFSQMAAAAASHFLPGPLGTALGGFAGVIGGALSSVFGQPFHLRNPVQANQPISMRFTMPPANLLQMARGADTQMLLREGMLVAESQGFRLVRDG